MRLRRNQAIAVLTLLSVVLVATSLEAAWFLAWAGCVIVLATEPDKDHADARRRNQAHRR